MRNEAGLKESAAVLHVRRTRLPADLDTPVSAFLKLRDKGAVFLLESAPGMGRLGRYSFIGFEAAQDGERPRGRVLPHPGPGREDPLQGLRDLLSDLRIEGEAEVPALLGAAVGAIGFDYIRYLESLPHKHPRPPREPLGEFIIVDALVVFDHPAHTMSVYSLGGERDARAQRRHDEILAALTAPLTRPAPISGPGPIEYHTDTERSDYMAMVRRTKSHIRAGDIFQAVLSRRLNAECRTDGFEVYRRLRMSNPSPYMFYLDFGGREIIGSSPEVLVRLQGRKALVSPIAGTRPRGRTPDEDEDLAKDLLADEKERAEHIMLVDLARNDLGRACVCGSIRVEGFMRIERYSHVMHLVSDVTGELSPGRDQFDLFRSAFPAGTVSGAPKVRAMEIIEELEAAPRGFYAGAVGYFSPSGDMDTCIAIRTVTLENDRAVLQAGAGIVADSDPAREFQETECKLAALKQALEAAQGGRP